MFSSFLSQYCFILCYLAFLSSLKICIVRSVMTLTWKHFLLILVIFLAVLFVSILSVIMNCFKSFFVSLNQYDLSFFVAKIVKRFFNWAHFEDVSIKVHSFFLIEPDSFLVLWLSSSFLIRFNLLLLNMGHRIFFNIFLFYLQLFNWVTVGDGPCFGCI